MSNTTHKLTYLQAYSIATSIKQRLAEYCDRIEIAGSIRRQKAEIGDIEILAISKGKQLHQALDERLADGRIRHSEPKRWGDKYRSFTLYAPSIDRNVKVDVFIVATEAWGMQFVIRTGSGIFSRNMVSPRRIGGFMPDGWRVQEGRIWVDGSPLCTPEETDVFRVYGMTFVEPPLRTDSYRPDGFEEVDSDAILATGDVAEGQLALFENPVAIEKPKDPTRWTK